MGRRLSQCWSDLRACGLLQGWQEAPGTIAWVNAGQTCYTTRPQDKNYAFAEFRSVEEASNAMALDGVAYGDVYLKIRWVERVHVIAYVQYLCQSSAAAQAH